MKFLTQFGQAVGWFSAVAWQPMPAVRPGKFIDSHLSPAPPRPVRRVYHYRCRRQRAPASASRPAVGRQKPRRQIDGPICRGKKDRPPREAGSTTTTTTQWARAGRYARSWRSPRGPSPRLGSHFLQRLALRPRPTPRRRQGRGPRHPRRHHPLGQELRLGVASQCRRPGNAGHARLVTPV